MALLSPRVPRLPLASHSAGAGALRCCGRVAASSARCQATAAGSVAAGSPSSSELEAIRWGSAKLQGAREEMEDEVVLRPESLLHGFSFAAVLDGHAGFSTVQFLRHARADHLLPRAAISHASRSLTWNFLGAAGTSCTRNARPRWRVELCLIPRILRPSRDRSGVPLPLWTPTSPAGQTRISFTPF